MGKKKSNIKSDCCNAEVKVGGIPDFNGDRHACTQYYVCTKCEEACNVHICQRKTWTRNPATKVKGDERGKQEIKLTKKEIEEFRRNEDF
jgi:hypothetical protein